MNKQKAQEDYLRETKALMRSKLEEHGVSIKNSTPFRSYVNGIDEAVETSVGKTVKKLVGIEYTTIDAQDLLGVTYLRKYALYRNSFIKEVTIPENVNNLGDYAFGTCLALERVTLPLGITIGVGCFNGCTALQKVYLPDIDVLDVDKELRPELADVSAFNNTTCNFVVPTEVAKYVYTLESSWTPYKDRFIVEEVSES